MIRVHFGQLNLFSNNNQRNCLVQFIYQSKLFSKIALKFKKSNMYYIIKAATNIALLTIIAFRFSKDIFFIFFFFKELLMLIDKKNYPNFCKMSILAQFSSNCIPSTIVLISLVLCCNKLMHKRSNNNCSFFKEINLLMYLYFCTILPKF